MALPWGEGVVEEVLAVEGALEDLPAVAKGAEARGPEARPAGGMEVVQGVEEMEVEQVLAALEALVAEVDQEAEVLVGEVAEAEVLAEEVAQVGVDPGVEGAVLVGVVAEAEAPVEGVAQAEEDES